MIAFKGLLCRSAGILGFEVSGLGLQTFDVCGKGWYVEEALDGADEISCYHMPVVY